MKKEGQSWLLSAVEAVSGNAVGFCIAWATNFLVLPWFGYYPDALQAFELTAIFTVISVIRVFIWRRMFNWYERQKS